MSANPTAPAKDPSRVINDFHGKVDDPYVTGGGLPSSLQGRSMPGQPSMGGNFGGDSPADQKWRKDLEGSVSRISTFIDRLESQMDRAGSSKLFAALGLQGTGGVSSSPPQKRESETEADEARRLRDWIVSYDNHVLLMFFFDFLHFLVHFLVVF